MYACMYLQLSVSRIYVCMHACMLEVLAVSPQISRKAIFMLTCLYVCTYACL